ncbi:YciI family protein [Spelaeicoccus albus]|uniref:YCII-related domain-containing protein n=1 Tax=Spelaeicoccus albus TaxID=1280376 RepID=A0A7Z0D460_9MICO|nr:YciI family protein [Spelaeicoccus albus]NYI68563.1 hypothetical protein [Spelaeicoccus albus]
MSVFLVLYTYGADDATRMEVRPKHRAWLSTQQETGALLAAGAYSDDKPAGAGLVIEAESEDAVRELLTHDPYRAAGVIDNTEIRQWGLVLGTWTE